MREFTGHRWIPLRKASDAELWCFLWPVPWINDWVANREAGGLRRHRCNYDVIVMTLLQSQTIFTAQYVTGLIGLLSYVRFNRLIYIYQRTTWWNIIHVSYAVCKTYLFEHEIHLPKESSACLTSKRIWPFQWVSLYMFLRITKFADVAWWIAVCEAYLVYHNVCLSKKLSIRAVCRSIENVWFTYDFIYDARSWQYVEINHTKQNLRMLFRTHEYTQNVVHKKILSSFCSELFFSMFS